MHNQEVPNFGRCRVFITCNEWLPYRSENSDLMLSLAIPSRTEQLFTGDRIKEIIVSSLRVLVKHGRIKVFGFVLMPNQKREWVEL
jgi:hypothetical protein